MDFLVALEFLPNFFRQFDGRRILAHVLLDKDRAELNLQVFFFLRWRETFKREDVVAFAKRGVVFLKVETCNLRCWRAVS